MCRRRTEVTDRSIAISRYPVPALAELPADIRERMLAGTAR
jgi:hypothetical protein